MLVVALSIAFTVPLVGTFQTWWTQGTVPKWAWASALVTSDVGKLVGISIL